MTALPDVPTTAEAGLPNYETSGWLVLLAPRGTPKPVIAKLNRELDAAARRPGGARPLHRAGRRAASRYARRSSPKFIASETAKWRDIIDKAGITIQMTATAAPALPPSDMTIEDSVLIAGAGPVGLAAAANLVRQRRAGDGAGGRNAT